MDKSIVSVSLFLTHGVYNAFNLSNDNKKFCFIYLADINVSKLQLTTSVSQNLGENACNEVICL